MRTKPGVVATMVFGVSFSVWSQVAMTTWTSWSQDLIHNQALDEERTSEDDDVKRVLVEFYDAHDWKTEFESA